MAEKKAKTAEKGAGAARVKHLCPSCNVESQVTYFTGFGRKGYFWVCSKNCGYVSRTR
jgi:hypothetical protein